MYSKIIAGYDGRPSSEDALALAKAIAEVTGAKLTAAGVFLADPFWGGPDPHFQELEADTREQIESAAKAAGAEPLTRPSSSTARGLHELAEQTRSRPDRGGGRRAPARSVGCWPATSRSASCTARRARWRWRRRATRAGEQGHQGGDRRLRRSPEAHAAMNDALEFARARRVAEGRGRRRAAADDLRQGRGTRGGAS